MESDWRILALPCVFSRIELLMLTYLFYFHKEHGKHHCYYIALHWFQMYIQNKRIVCFFPLCFPTPLLSFCVSDLISVSWISSGHFPTPFLDFIFSAVRKTVVKTHTEVSKDFVSHKHTKEMLKLQFKINYFSHAGCGICVHRLAGICLYIYDSDSDS